MEKHPCVYILTNKRNGTLYIGVTSNLPKRIWEHKINVVKGFTEQYGLKKLVWHVESRNDDVSDSTRKGHEKLEKRVEIKQH